MEIKTNGAKTKSENKRTHRYVWYLGVLVAIFIILLTTNIYNPTEQLLFKQGDNHIFIVDIESGEKTEILVFHKRFVFGICYFTYKENEYLGYIEANKIETAHFEYYFKYIKLNNLNEIVDTTKHSVKLDLNKSLDTSSHPLLDSLNVQSLNNTLIFSTIISQGTTQSNSISSIMQFDMNGKILNIIDYSIDNFNDAKILDFEPYSNNTYIILSTLGDGERINSESKHLLLYNTFGEATNFTNLEKEVSAIGFNPAQNTLLTSERGIRSVDHRTLKGELIKTVPIGIETYKISFMYGKYMLIQDYRNPVYTPYEITRIVMYVAVLLVIIPTIFSYSSNLYSKYKNRESIDESNYR
ncbi:MAG: hypothetical protein HeimC2_32410 [Candidatus Heimdallarchaeota archaeon LC_2]|nr:MAG: hypothetical protein HeimC2_32410 [Candidatus Heimdallarchaeota archaeon LC_2]